MSEQHYHLFAVCRKCGPKDMLPLPTLDAIREHIRGLVDEMPNSRPDATLNVTSRNSDGTLVEFTVTKKDSGESHDYILTYRYCDVDVSVCLLMAAMRMAAVDKEDKEPDVKPPFMGFELPKDGYKYGNN